MSGSPNHKIRYATRMTEQKRRFAQLLVRGLALEIAATEAGYKNPKSAYKYARKNDAGQWLDPQFGAYVDYLEERGPSSLETSAPEVEVLDSYRDVTRDAVLLEMAKILFDRSIPPGARVRAGEAILKQIRVEDDRNQYVERDADEIRRVAHSLLGLKR